MDTSEENNNIDNHIARYREGLSSVADRRNNNLYVAGNPGVIPEIRVEGVEEDKYEDELERSLGQVTNTDDSDTLSIDSFRPEDYTVPASVAKVTGYVESQPRSRGSVDMEGGKGVVMASQTHGWPAKVENKRLFSRLKRSDPSKNKSSPSIFYAKTSTASDTRLNRHQYSPGNTLTWRKSSNSVGMKELLTGEKPDVAMTTSPSNQHDSPTSPSGQWTSGHSCKDPACVTMDSMKRNHSNSLSDITDSDRERKHVSQKLLLSSTSGGGSKSPWAQVKLHFMATKKDSSTNTPDKPADTPVDCIDGEKSVDIRISDSKPVPTDKPAQSKVAFFGWRQAAKKASSMRNVAQVVQSDYNGNSSRRTNSMNRKVTFHQSLGVIQQRVSSKSGSLPCPLSPQLRTKREDHGKDDDLEEFMEDNQFCVSKMKVEVSWSLAGLETRYSNVRDPHDNLSPIIYAVICSQII